MNNNPGLLAMKPSIKFWIIFILLGGLTFYSIYFYIKQKINYHDYIEHGEEYWYAHHPGAFEVEYRKVEQDLINWILKAEFYLWNIGALDVVVFFVFSAINFKKYVDHKREKNKIAFQDLPTDLQQKVLTNNFCKTCKKIQEMIFIEEKRLQGIEMYYLMCNTCNTITKIRNPYLNK